MTLDLKYPKDEPGTIQGLTQTLEAVAGDLDGAQQRLVGHGSGLRGGWRDQAGAAAAAETDALGRIVHTGAQGMRRAGGALRTYHGAITSAREEIDKLRTRYANAQADRSDTLRMARRMGEDRDPQSWTSIRDSASETLAAAEGQIRGEYDAVMRNVTTAAGTAASALDGVAYALGVRRGGGDVNLAVTDFMDRNLPIWHQEHMVAVANEAYAITQNPFPTDEELARLASYDRYMYDPHFATQLMNRMGPEGLLWFTASLQRMLPYSGSGNGQQRTSALSRIQTMLGIGLATATTRSNPVHVDQAWVDKLEEEGRRKIDYGSYSFQPYGYQVLGNLLRRGHYSTEFLNDVGGDMYAFERENGGASVWMLNHPSGAMYDGTRLDLVDGTGGFDPMAGLMEAMGRNTDAAKAFFDPQAHPGRIDYMLTDRIWDLDLPSGTMVEADMQPRGFNQLGNVLEYAALDEPRDAVSARIAAETIHQLAVDEQVTDRKGVVVPDAIKDNVGNIVAGYIDDVNFTMAHDGDPGRSLFSTRDSELFPGVEGAHAVFDRTELLRVMYGASHDPDAYATMLGAQKAYTAVAFEHYAGNPNALQASAQSSASVFGALDEGRSHAIRDEYGARDAEYNEAIERNGAIANFVFGKAAEAIKNPLISETVGLGVESYIDALVENSKQDSTNLANAEAAQVYGDGRASVREMAQDALWRHSTPPVSVQTQYPGLFENGQPRPLADIMANETLRGQFESYATSEHYLSTIGRIVGETDQSYSTGRDRAREATSGG